MPIAGHSFQIVTVNSFIEDTAVLVATAYLIVRGPMERMLANPIFSGLAFGIFAATEVVFPDARFPYASHTLMCAFITGLIGWRAGVLTASVALVAAIVLRSPAVLETMAIQLAITLAVMTGVAGVTRYRPQVVVGATAGAQALSVGVGQLILPGMQSLCSTWTVLANTFGAVLLGLVIRDARTREEAERHQKELVEARVLAVEAQLLTLRGRIQPHFLYNALNSIAALCKIAPDRASKAAVNLGSLMRQSLERRFDETRSLAEELETVRNYVDIEMERFGHKVSVKIDVTGCEDIKVPPFGVQILVENAILHGVSRLTKGGTVRVFARRKMKFAFIGVADDGIGLPKVKSDVEAPHGLTLLRSLIDAQKTPGGRLRLARRPTGGTLAVIRVPLDRGNFK